LQGLILRNSLQNGVNVHLESFFRLGRLLNLLFLEMPCIFFGLQVLFVLSLLKIVHPNLIILAFRSHSLVLVIEIVLIVELDFNTIHRPGAGLEQMPGL
jgi:hypothetical protein